MSVQELITLHTVCDLERTQLLTSLAMSEKNPQLAGFLITGNRSNFLYVEGSTHCFMTAFIFYHLYIEQTNGLIEFPYTIEKL